MLSGERAQRRSDPERVDGRRVRAERTHRTVVDALRECMRSGDAEPTARSVAARAGVSLRAVFRHFHNLDRLFAEVYRLEYEEATRAALAPDPSAALIVRVQRFVRERARRNDRLSLVRRGAKRFEHTPALREQYERTRLLEHREIERYFARELAMAPAGVRAERVAAVSACCGPAFWDAIRRHERIAPPAARAVLERLVVAALCPPT